MSQFRNFARPHFMTSSSLVRYSIVGALRRPDDADEGEAPDGPHYLPLRGPSFLFGFQPCSVQISPISHLPQAAASDPGINKSTARCAPTITIPPTGRLGESPLHPWASGRHDCAPTRGENGILQ